LKFVVNGRFATVDSSSFAGMVVDRHPGSSNGIGAETGERFAGAFVDCAFAFDANIPSTGLVASAPMRSSFAA
jgi:hypothetical protein